MVQVQVLVQTWICSFFKRGPSFFLRVPCAASVSIHQGIWLHHYLGKFRTWCSEWWGCLWPVLDLGMGRIGSMSPLLLRSHCYCPACSVCYWVEYHVCYECIHGSFLIFNTTYCTSSLVTFWLADPLKVVLLATHFACLTPCRGHLWLVTWFSSTILVATTTSTYILVGFHSCHGPFVFVVLGWLGYILGWPLLVICWHLKPCYIWGTGYFVLISRGHFKCFGMAYILLQGLQQPCFGQDFCLQSIGSFAM